MPTACTVQILTSRAGVLLSCAACGTVLRLPVDQQVIEDRVPVFLEEHDDCVELAITLP